MAALRLRPRFNVVLLRLRERPVVLGLAGGAGARSLLHVQPPSPQALGPLPRPLPRVLHGVSLRAWLQRHAVFHEDYLRVRFVVSIVLSVCGVRVHRHWPHVDRAGQEGPPPTAQGRCLLPRGPGCITGGPTA